MPGSERPWSWLERVLTGVALLALSACAPTSSSSQAAPGLVNSGQAAGTSTQSTSPITSLAVNPSGALVCIAGGNAFLLEAGRFTRLPAPANASSAAWHAGAWWLALPKTGLVFKVTGVPDSLSFTGQPMQLTSRFVFTAERQVLTYDKLEVGRLPGLPSSLLENGDATFALVGKTVYSLSSTGLERRQTLNAGTYSLVARNDGYEALPGLAARGDGYTYRVDGNTLIASDSASRETARAGFAGNVLSLVAGNGFVALAAGATLRVLRAGNLAPMLEFSCGGA